MERSQIHRVSVADQVASVLRQRILKGELRPGMPLQEVPLAASLGVSRNTMREATRILSLEGLLKRSVHRGVAVSHSLSKMLRRFITCAECSKFPPCWLLSLTVRTFCPT
jgi:DNA-binding GntR family transcriptional regulator